MDPAECVERLLRDFRTYDRAVDVVSAFEMLFTKSDTDVPGTVRHFERFPSVPPEGSGGALTPDFTVVFEDGTGLAGEIARIALHDNSVEGLCSQIAKYDELKQLPGDAGLTDVLYTDVLLLVPQAVGMATIKRVLIDRLGEPGHPYKPSVAPCIVQFGFDEGKYTFQRLPAPENGGLREDGRTDGIGNWFAENGDISVKPLRFSDIKADRAFINDPVDPLYLSTHLWAKTFPTMTGDVPLPARLEVSADVLADELREAFGRVRKGDVERALGLLKTGKLAEETTDGWVVAFEELRTVGDADLAHLLAQRACHPPTRSALSRLERAEEAEEARPNPPPSLF